MKTLNISDELYTQITKTLNDTRNSKNSITHELESQQIDLGTALSELKHPSAVTELLSAERTLQANIVLLNTILRATTHANSKNAIDLEVEKTIKAHRNSNALRLYNDTLLRFSND